jgi:hypothetical protein
MKTIWPEYEGPALAVAGKPNEFRLLTCGVPAPITIPIMMKQTKKPWTNFSIPFV